MRCYRRSGAECLEGSAVRFDKLALVLSGDLADFGCGIALTGQRRNGNRSFKVERLSGERFGGLPMNTDQRKRTQRPHSDSETGAVAIITVPLIATADDSPDADFKMRPIGHVQKTEDRTVIVLEKEYEPGLLGLDGFSHIYVVWWFSQCSR